jgi:methylthioribose-1-phosphate isomerase
MNESTCRQIVDGQDVGVLPVRLEHERILLVDQRALPDKLELFDATELEDMCFAIREMVVRGAPSIGVAAALALATYGKKSAKGKSSTKDLLHDLQQAGKQLESTRPTAVNLKWAIEKIYLAAADEVKRDGNIAATTLADRLVELATSMLDSHIKTNMLLSTMGSSLIPQNASILTHCNAGSLATCGWGTALGVIRSAKGAGLNPSVFVDETRPRNQGSRLTIWELVQDGIPCTLICDSLAGYLMAKKKIDLVIVGADRIALNGDTANKVGTYSLAVLAKAHGIPFYVAAPLSTFDPSLPRGDEIVIEERSAEELIKFGDHPITLSNANALNLAFDVTPGSLITAIITEGGILRSSYERSIPQILGAEKQRNVEFSK